MTPSSMAAWTAASPVRSWAKSNTRVCEPTSTDLMKPKLSRPSTSPVGAGIGEEEGVGVGSVLGDGLGDSVGGELAVTVTVGESGPAAVEEFPHAVPSTATDSSVATNLVAERGMCIPADFVTLLPLRTD